MEHLTELDKGPNGESDALPRQAPMLLTDDYIKQRIIFLPVTANTDAIRTLGAKCSIKPLLVPDCYQSAVSE